MEQALDPHILHGNYFNVRDNEKSRLVSSWILVGLPGSIEDTNEVPAKPNVISKQTRGDVGREKGVVIEKTRRKRFYVTTTLILISTKSFMTT